MSCRGKHPWQSQRRMGIQGHPVATVFENLEAGLTVEEVMEEFSVTREQINAVLHFAAKSLAAPFPPQAHTTPADARSL